HPTNTQLYTLSLHDALPIYVHRGTKENHMVKFSIVIALWLVLGLTHSCIEVSNQYTMVAPGVWRGMLDLRYQSTLPPHPEPTDPVTRIAFSNTSIALTHFLFHTNIPTPDTMLYHLITL